MIDKKMRPATDHGAGRTARNHDAEPLTTPIYETTTFVFDSAAEVTAYNEGRSKKFLYSRYGNPTVLAVEETIAALEGAETAMLLASGRRRRRPRCWRCSRAATRSSAAPRSTAARCTCSRIFFRATASRPASRRSTSSRDPERVIGDAPRCCGSSRRSTRRSAASTSRRSPPPAGAAASSRSSTTPSPARSTSSRSRWASTSSCTA